ncbi:hypothetical protein NPIL_242031 [Nephila pilipes]|uniref:Uncharacterized protein n=1 Tax=Nephila pilipes TaxID=299642 RepID=A0A8X6PN76_NEPPI|nr:hypothetical protein NPIL_242031 [Nephila pilipes]
MASHGAESNQPEILLTFRTAYNKTTTAVNSFIYKNLKSVPLYLESNKAVVCFSLATEHDYLQAHLHRIGLALDETRPATVMSDLQYGWQSLVELLRTRQSICSHIIRY